MKLEVGKYYKTRDGQKVGPMRDDWSMDNRFKWHTKSGILNTMLWDEFGTNYYGTSPRPVDLVAEWTDTPTIGTLAEIGAQVGDVVEWLEDDDVTEHTITEMTTDKHPFPSHAQLDFTMLVPIDDSGYKFSIVSRAQPQGPVITETVKRIVPGVYGKVEIDAVYDDNVAIHMGGSRGPELMSRADLIAARDVFNQLIDAMPQE